MHSVAVYYCIKQTGRGIVKQKFRERKSIVDDKKRRI